MRLVLWIRAAVAALLFAANAAMADDAGNRTEHILPLRADERAGKILSPRIFATGNLITYPGSHGDHTAVRISDFEKDKALLDQQFAAAAAGHTTNTGFARLSTCPVSCAPWKRFMLEATLSPIQ